MAVDKPNAKFVKDGKEMTNFKGEIVSIEYIDAIDNEVDGISIVFAKMYDPPLFGDKIEIFIGLNQDLEELGTFYVSGNAENIDEGTFEVRFTSVGFSKSIKEKRTVTYNNITLHNILLTIAQRHQLKLINDDETSKYISKSQTNESDLAFMKRLAEETGATFSIKNDTIIFRFKASKEDNNLPVIKLNPTIYSHCKIERVDKTIYQSGIASWHDMDSNAQKAVKIGEGDPVFRLEGSFKNDADAMQKLKSAMQRENGGSVRGSLNTVEHVIAGAVLELELDLDGRVEKNLQITQVRHLISSGGYIKTVQFGR